MIIVHLSGNGTLEETILHHKIFVTGKSGKKMLDVHRDVCLEL